MNEIYDKNNTIAVAAYYNMFVNINLIVQLKLKKRHNIVYNTYIFKERINAYSNFTLHLGSLLLILHCLGIGLLVRTNIH